MNLREALARYLTCLNNGINRAIDGGTLYNIVDDLSTTDAKIFGLGVPGDGVDYLVMKRMVKRRMVKKRMFQRMFLTMKTQ